MIRITAIAPEVLDRLRAQGHDDHGNAFRPFTDHEGRSPLRCCLTLSKPGERIALIAYSPFQRSSAYAEVGPVFVHAARCAGYIGNGYPDDFRGRRQILRAYDAEGAIADAVMVEADADPLPALEALLARKEIERVHTRNVLYGCFMLEATRR